MILFFCCYIGYYTIFHPEIISWDSVPGQMFFQATRLQRQNKIHLPNSTFLQALPNITPSMQAKLTNILQVPLSCRPGSSATGTSPHTSNVGSDLPRQLVLPLRAVSRRFSPILKMEHRKIGFYQNPLTIPSSEKQIPQSKNTMNELFNIQFLYKKESRS